MTSAFYSNDSVANRKILLDVPALEDTEFDVAETAQWINTNQFTRVALQFPDDLLEYSTSCLTVLQESTSALLFILADTSYGSCCVDEVAAEHYGANAIVHYGMTCCSVTQRLPVHFVTAKYKLDVGVMENSIISFCENIEDIIVVTEPCYYHKIADIEEVVGKFVGDIVIAKKTISDGSCGIRVGDLTVDLRQCKDDCPVLYVGREKPVLLSWMYALPAHQFISYDPLLCTTRCESLSVNKLLMKRYYMVEKVRDSSVIGILCGTLGVSGYLDIIIHIKAILRNAGKKCYTISVGKPNVAKLANFPLIDVFVLVSCPWNCLNDFSDYYAPVVTPYELEVALNPSREWSNDYCTNFQLLLPGALKYLDPKHVTLPDADMSIITGAMRKENTPLHGDTNEPMAVVTQNLQVQRITEEGRNPWWGLRPSLGENMPSLAVEGSMGIAMKYEHEPDIP